MLNELFARFDRLAHVRASHPKCICAYNLILVLRFELIYFPIKNIRSSVH